MFALGLGLLFYDLTTIIVV